MSSCIDLLLAYKREKMKVGSQSYITICELDVTLRLSISSRVLLLINSSRSFTVLSAKREGNAKYKIYYADKLSYCTESFIT